MTDADRKYTQMGTRELLLQPESFVSHESLNALNDLIKWKIITHCSCRGMLREGLLLIWSFTRLLTDLDRDLSQLGGFDTNTATGSGKCHTSKLDYQGRTLTLCEQVILARPILSQQILCWTAMGSPHRKNSWERAEPQCFRVAGLQSLLHNRFLRSFIEEKDPLGTVAYQEIVNLKSHIWIMTLPYKQSYQIHTRSRGMVRASQGS
jgi:hypothetical protein